MITRHGLGVGDKVVFLFPDWRDEGCLNAIASLKSLIRQIDSRIEVEELPVPLYNVNEAIVKIAKHIGSEASKGRRIVINLSGGMRILIVETLLATQISGAKDVVVEAQSEDRRIIVNFPKLWNYTQNFTKNMERIITTLLEKVLGIRKLSLACKLPLTTTHRLVKKLEKQGIIEIKRVGKEKNVSLTYKGKIIAQILKKE